MAARARFWLPLKFQLMKLWLNILLLVFWGQCLPVKAQNTFNQKYHFNTLATYLTSIVVNDSCYYATGIYADTVPNLQVGSVFIKFDLEGNLSFCEKVDKP